MGQKIMYLGIDVDDKAFHGCGIIGEGKKEQMIDFKCKPSVGALMHKINTFKKEGYEVHSCYEATYVGFTLSRDLIKHGLDCEVIAPSSIPRPTGQTVKTDKVDCRKLAKYYKNGLLKIVRVPDASEEFVRGLIRTRMFISRQLKDLKKHILGVSRLAGLDYKKSTGLKNPAYFTQMHFTWIEKEIKNIKSEEFQFNIKMLLTF